MNLAILQARMSSSRLPGKVLAPVLGMPMIGRQLERLARARRIDQLLVATSTDPSDDPLAAYVESLGLPVCRGSLSDVLDRFRQAAGLVRTFPHGLDVEAIRPSALREAAERAVDPYEREHVTPYINRRPETYRLVSVTRTPSLAHLRWTVDLPADLAFVRGVYASLYPTDPAFTSDAIVALDPHSAPIPE